MPHHPPTLSWITDGSRSPGAKYVPGDQQPPFWHHCNYSHCKRVLEPISFFVNGGFVFLKWQSFMASEFHFPAIWGNLWQSSLTVHGLVEDLPQIMVTNFFRSSFAPFFSDYLGTVYVLNVAFIFDRCHCSWAAVAPVKYNYNSWDLKETFSKISLTVKLMNSVLFYWVNSSLDRFKFFLKNLAAWLHLYLTGAFTEISCGVTCQISMWFNRLNLYFLQDPIYP